MDTKFKLKIPLQEKIAELEQRIIVLESRPCRCRVVSEKTFVSVDISGNPHWHALWREFDALVKSIFKGVS